MFQRRREAAREVWSRTPELHLRLRRFLRSCVAECRRLLCRSCDPERFQKSASRNLCSPGSFQAGAPTSAAHLKWPAQFALDRNRSPKLDSLMRTTAVLRQLADEIFDVLGLMAMT